ncbi:MAG: 30S ribosomal protein S16 [Bdellovibrionales bacterium]|nr:30S ribosomal protein S16 [Bdellovibrionales bacterium]
MVVIRLARRGSKHDPKYRITVADQRRWVKGKFIEIIGHYDPSASGKAEKLNIDLAKANDWIKKGAQPTERVKSLLKQAQSN